MGGKWYAVRVGRQPGIYEQWSQVQPLVSGYTGAQHKSFKSRSEAEQYLRAGGGPSSRPSGPRSIVATATVTSGVLIVQEHREAAAGGSRKRTRQEEDAPPPAHPAPFQRYLASFGIEAAPLAERQQQAPQRPGSASVPAAPAGGWGAVGGQSGAFAAVREGPLEPINPGLLYQLEFDGAARGNPGQAGAGAVLRRKDTGVVVCRLRRYLGPRSTNNEAEYGALIEGLRMARDVGVQRLLCKGDSKLVVMQVRGSWQIHKEHLQALCSQVVEEAEGLQEFAIEHIRREWNTDADKLSNDAIDLAYT